MGMLRHSPIRTTVASGVPYGSLTNVFLSLLGVGQNVSPNIQYSLFVLFCLALGFAAFSLAREQSKTFGAVALLVGLFSFTSPFVFFLWMPGLLRH